jgi:hypothetical protein
MLTAALQVGALQAKIAAFAAAKEAGMKAGVAAGAQLFEDEAKTLVPVKSGNLRDHIHTETVTDEAQVQTLAVTPTIEASNKYGFEPPYARRIEKGFIGVDSLGRHYNQAAQPYMAPAFENKRQEATDAIKQGVIQGGV